MKDEIIQEVWKAKEDIAARYDHNIRVMVDHLRKKEHSSSALVVDLHSRAEKQRTKKTENI